MDEFTQELLNVFSYELDLIAQRISYKRTKHEICKWLDNFDENDRISAIEILQRLLYINEDQLYIGADQLLNDILSKVPEKSILYLYPIAKYGKSSTLFSYYLKKSSVFKKLEREHRVFFLKYLHEYNSTVIYENTVLVFFDDFFGSGGSFIKSHKNITTRSSPKILTAKYQFAAALYRMNEAELAIKSSLPTIEFVGGFHYRIFGTQPSYFTTASQISLKKILAESYAYRKNLFVGINNVHDLGYNGSEALISFPYMPPNNTLPIIWSSNSAWYPLLPRDVDDIKQRDRDYKITILSSAAKLEFGLSPGEYRNFDKSRLNVLLVLTYLKRQVALPIIAIEVGIDSKYLEDLLQRAQNMGYLDSTKKLTAIAESHLSELYTVKRNILKEEINKTDVRNFEVIYQTKTVPRK